MPRGLSLELDKAEFNRLDNATKARVRASLEAVKAIEEWTEGEVTVNFAPNAWIEDDQKGMNHLFFGSLSSEEDHLWLDDRKPAPLVAQMASELRRLAAHCEHLAERIECRAAEAEKTEAQP